jgi:predicted tellurium resistance membrane protein TerC
MDWVIGLLTLTVLEIVLGIDNIVFISILAGKLPQEQQVKARRTGLALALITRILLLLSLAWVIRLTRPLFTIYGAALSGRDLVLILGGLFLIAKSTHEIHSKLEGVEGEVTARLRPSYASVVTQIMLLDIVFSLDSVITAVGMVSQIWVMVTAVILAMLFMLFFVNAVSDFVDKHPTVKMLALSFLVLIGVTLLAEGFHQHIPRGYIYFAMAYSVVVEMLNLKLRKREPVHLHDAIK